MEKAGRLQAVGSFFECDDHLILLAASAARKTDCEIVELDANALQEYVEKYAEAAGSADD